MARPSPVDAAHAADADLAEQAAAGDNSAFAELYRRHADAAWRVAQAVTHNPDDAADAVSEAFTKVLQALPQGRLHEGANFRAYLLTATRRASVDQLRRRNRQQPGGDADSLKLDARAATTGSPSEKLMQATDSALVAAAFRGLPERWRSVLWLTEVEQIPAKEAAPLLGMSPNGVAQLAVRARNGLRERYIQAHLRSDEVVPECRHTVERLGAYVGGGLAARDIAKVDQHLAGCAPCRARQAELEELGGRLRRIVLPLPLGLGAAAWKAFRHKAGLSATGKVVKTAAWAAKAERPLAVLSAALFAAGLAGTQLVGGETLPTPLGPAQAGAAEPPKDRVLFDVQPNMTGPFRLGSIDGPEWSLRRPGAEDLSAERRLLRNGSGNGNNATPLPIQVNDDDVLPIDPDPDDRDPDEEQPPPPPPPPPPPAKPAAQLQATVSANGTTVSVAAGHGDNACTGGTVAGRTAGCTPPPPNSDAIFTVSTGGTAVPVEKEIGLP